MKSGWKYSGCWLFVLLAWAGGLCAQQADVGPSQKTADALWQEIKISSGRGCDHTCIWSESGAVTCWGDNAVKQEGQSIEVLDVKETDEGVEIKRLGCGVEFCCALLSNGKAKCWGTNNLGQLGNYDRQQHRDEAVYVRNYTDDKGYHDRVDMTDISVGLYHVCALLVDGNVLCWGDNVKGQLGPLVSKDTTDTSVPTLAFEGGGAVAIAPVGADGNRTCVLIKDESGERRQLKCWGWDSDD